MFCLDKEVHMMKDLSRFTQLLQLIMFTKKHALSLFVWVLSLIILSVSLSRWACQNGGNNKTSPFFLHACWLQGRSGEGEGKCWVVIQLKIMRVEGSSSGVLLYWTWRTQNNALLYIRGRHEVPCYALSVPQTYVHLTQLIYFYLIECKFAN